MRSQAPKMFFAVFHPRDEMLNVIYLTFAISRRAYTHAQARDGNDHGAHA